MACGSLENAGQEDTTYPLAGELRNIVCAALLDWVAKLTSRCPVGEASRVGSAITATRSALLNSTHPRIYSTRNVFRKNSAQVVIAQAGAVICSQYLTAVGDRRPVWVSMRRIQTEHNKSVYPPTGDIRADIVDANRRPGSPRS
jgi:hypothetical protein